MDFESCYESIWRSGLLHKASGKAIVGRMWLYLKNFLTDRKYCIQVINYKSQVYQFAFGIPQGSVISPLLCNLYTSDSMDRLRSYHTEYANDSNVVTSDESLKVAAGVVSEDLFTKKKWCGRWKMLIAFPWDGRLPDEDFVVENGEGGQLKVTGSKKVLDVVLDSLHIQKKDESRICGIVKSR